MIDQDDDIQTLDKLLGAARPAYRQMAPTAPLNPATLLAKSGRRLWPAAVAVALVATVASVAFVPHQTPPRPSMHSIPSLSQGPLTWRPISTSPRLPSLTRAIRSAPVTLPRRPKERKS